MGSPHLEEEWIGGNVDLDLLFKSPQKDARIIGGMGDEASSKGPTMVVNFVHKSIPNCWGRRPFYRVKQMWPLEKKWGSSGSSGGKSVGTGICAAPFRRPPEISGGHRNNILSGRPAQSGLFRRSPKLSGGRPGAAETADRKTSRKTTITFAPELRF